MSLKFISLDLSNYCSKQCSFCYNHSTTKGNTEWQPQEVIHFVLDCHAHGVEAVSLGGGEPFEYDGIFEIIAAIKSELYVSVTTNGLPLTNENVFRQLCLMQLLPNRRTGEQLHVWVGFLVYSIEIYQNACMSQEILRTLHIGCAYVDRILKVLSPLIYYKSMICTTFKH